MGSGYHWLKTQFPAVVAPWGEVVGILGFFTWIGLCVWAFLAFRRPAPLEAKASAGEPSEWQTADADATNRPKGTLQVVGGAKHAKRGIAADSSNP